MRSEISSELANKNYHMKPIPHDKAKSEYNTDQRRAWILEKYLSGELDEMNKKELSSEFDVRRKQLYKDINVVRLWIRENPDDALVDNTVKRANSIVEKLIDEGEYNKAGKRNENLMDVLQDAGLIEKKPDKIEKETKVKEIGFNVMNTTDDESDE